MLSTKLISNIEIQKDTFVCAFEKTTYDERTETTNQQIVVIHHNEDPLNPRTDLSCITELVCFNSGEYSSMKHMTESEFEEYCQEIGDDVHSVVDLKIKGDRTYLIGKAIVRWSLLKEIEADYLPFADVMAMVKEEISIYEKWINGECYYGTLYDSRISYVENMDGFSFEEIFDGFHLEIEDFNKIDKPVIKTILEV